ncbi:short-chain dehydrogenase [Bdellovibrio sp. qaytius]|nr:short-chain dehydrogenase [Bdellovibrio sp. qaytius]
MGLLENKTALVTGAGSGIGREIALHFAAEGAKVLVSDINDLDGQKTVSMVRERKGVAEYFHANSGSPQECEALVNEAMNKFGGLHIAVNNAGVGGPSVPVGEYPIDGWDRVIQINLSGVFYGMRYQIPALLKSGGGSIVNIASILGQVAFPNSCAYVAAKHGVIGLTQNAAVEYATQNIRINAIEPGFIKTPLLEKNMTPEAFAMLEKKHPMGRLGESSEVAELCTWLSSSKASFVTGSFYPIDGGYLAQ